MTAPTLLPKRLVSAERSFKRRQEFPDSVAALTWGELVCGRPSALLFQPPALLVTAVGCLFRFASHKMWRPATREVTGTNESTYDPPFRIFLIPDMFLASSSPPGQPSSFRPSTERGPRSSAACAAFSVCIPTRRSVRPRPRPRQLSPEPRRVPLIQFCHP